MQLGEGLVLIGGMHGSTDDVLDKAGLIGVRVEVDHAADHGGGLNLLALDAKQLREPPP